MPRKKSSNVRNWRSREGSVVESVCSQLGETYVTSTVCDLNDMNMIETQIEEKFEEMMDELEAKKSFQLNNLNFRLPGLMLSIPESILNKKVDMNDETLRSIFMNPDAKDEAPAAVADTTVGQTVIKRRRSRSVRGVQLHDYKENKLDYRTSKKRRSTSLDLYKTPQNKRWLQALTSAKKYTVSKPAKVEESAINIRRIMKPDEEAISISGSPLMVQPTVATAPSVNIPLPGGVVMNILPKRTRGQFVVPEFDETTKQQLKLLCQQLNNLV